MLLLVVVLPLTHPYLYPPDRDTIELIDLGENLSDTPSSAPTESPTGGAVQ